jgi:excisionase family DNA binding protein
MDSFSNLIDSKQAAQLLGCTKRKLENDRIKGGGIPFIKIGRLVRYDRQDLLEFIQAHKFSSTSNFNQ